MKKNLSPIKVKIKSVSSQVRLDKEKGIVIIPSGRGIEIILLPEIARKGLLREYREKLLKEKIADFNLIERVVQDIINNLEENIIDENSEVEDNEEVEEKVEKKIKKGKGRKEKNNFEESDMVKDNEDEDEDEDFLEDL